MDSSNPKFLAFILLSLSVSFSSAFSAAKTARLETPLSNKLTLNASRLVVKRQLSSVNFWPRISCAYFEPASHPYRLNTTNTPITKEKRDTVLFVTQLQVSAHHLAADVATPIEAAKRIELGNKHSIDIGLGLRLTLNKKTAVRRLASAEKLINSNVAYRAS